ncbi:MAG: efflux RND transporter periplasmic adaptor subunit [Phycisphaerae bacterium]|nr:efflux RND transporter periplasmic adaptor subunit [Phycisphaerae bacterium]
MKPKSSKISVVVRKAVVVVLLIAAFLAGYLLRSHLQTDHAHAGPTDANKPTVAQKWYCSMDPQIIRDGPGDCPICGMDLVPMPTDLAVAGAPRQLVVSEAAAALMDIVTTPVERRFVDAEIRMVGKIDYDETRVKHITAWVPGRIDRLYVDFKGTRVSKGDHMVYLYSKELLEDQRALLAAVEASKNIDPNSSSFANTFKFANVEAVRTRLRLRGLTDEQIAEIEKAGKTVDHVTIYAPMGGIVIDKHRTEGSWVDTGALIFTIADLSQVWVKLDAYESDMMWIRYGQLVEFTTEAYPSEVFKGKISFIDPTLDAKTRTVKLRVNVDNSQGKLKPEMFVRATVRAKVAQSGTVMDPEMAGKWICPMHPSVVKSQSGICEKCEMDLVTTESLGYVQVDTPNEAPLVIPASAPLITGKRAVVYVRLPDAEMPTFEGREIVLGPRAGDYYIVESGLAEGETVVTNGSFKIDSALQIQAKPSMMNSKTGEQTTCPIMGGPIDKQYFTTYKGKKVYFCCPGCEEEFLKEPEKYLAKLPQFKNQESKTTF